MHKNAVTTALSHAGTEQVADRVPASPQIEGSSCSWSYLTRPADQILVPTKALTRSL